MTGSDIEDLIARLKDAYEPKSFGVLPPRRLYSEAAEALAHLKTENEGWTGVFRLMLDDYQTSERHHPNHVLVPLKAFETARSVLAAREGKR